MRITLGGVSFTSDAFWGRIAKTDTCWKWTGGRNSHGYGQINVWTGDRKTTARAHRIAYELATGVIPEGMEVDHVCHTRICVNPDHLRLVTHKQNLENHAGLISSNTSGYRGVTWNKQNQKWWARVTHNSKPLHVGYFDTAEEAGAAAAAKRNELYTHNDMDRIAS